MSLSVTEFFTHEKHRIDEEMVLFLNSSFFNQGQWKNILKFLHSALPQEKSFRFITYDYAGIGKSHYVATDIRITQFLDEIKAIINWLGTDKIHIFEPGNTGKNISL